MKTKIHEMVHKLAKSFTDEHFIDPDETLYVVIENAMLLATLESIKSFNEEIIEVTNKIKSETRQDIYD